MKIELFKALAALNILKDTDKMEIHITKTGDDFTVMTVINMDGKKAHPVISGPADELDEAYLTEIQKPIEKIKGLVSNADSVDVTDDDATEGKPKKKKIETVKKDAVKKAETAKTTATSTTAETKQPTEKEIAKQAEEEKHKRLEEILAEIVTVQEAKRHIKEEALLKEAAELYPANKKYVEEYEKKVKYNNAMIVAEIITVPREDWEKEATKWH